MPWSCLQCETSNTDQDRFCQVCDFERRYTSTEVATLVKTPGPHGAHGPISGRAPSVPVPARKSPGAALLLSFLLTGLGQLYLGQPGKGVFLFVLAVVLGMMSSGLLGLVVWIFSMVDAYKLGQRSQQGFAIGKWDFL